MSSTPFKAGGALTDEYAAIYIERKADHDAMAHLRAMDYLLVIEPRQQGKTSLLARLRAKLGSSRYMFAYIDVEDLSYESEQAWFADLWNELSWYMGQVLYEVARRPPTDCQGWRDQMRSLAQFAKEHSFQVIIALDEVGSMAKAPWAEPFFVGLRKFYNQRAFALFCKELTFVLAGAFHPRDLITDDKISPFNIAQRVRLADFTPKQVRDLVGKGGWPADQAAALAARIHYWTDGQPYLTQLLCTYLAQQDTSVTLDDVDAGVERLRREDENHLPPLLKRLNSDRKLCEYVGRIQAGERIKFYPGEDRRQAHLELLGVLKADSDGYCAIRNRICELALAELVSPGTKPAETPQPEDEFHYDAFISYSHKDSAWVRDTLLPRLESEGLHVCIDYRDFEPGAPSLTEMERAVLQSRKTLLVLTPNYLASEWAEFENILASTLDPAARRRRVIPLLLKPCELPLRIRALNYVDFTKPHESESQFERLIAALQKTALAAVSGEPLSFGPEEEKTPQAVSAPSIQKSSAHPNEQPVVDSSRGMRSRYVQTVGNISAEVAAAAFDAFVRDSPLDTLGIRFERKRDIAALVEYAAFTVDIDPRSNLNIGESDRGTVRFQTLPGGMLEVSIEVLPTPPDAWRATFVPDETMLNLFDSFVDYLRGLGPSPPADPTLQAKKRRLHFLKLERARKGYNTPPEVLLEIEDLERELGEYRE